MQPMPVPGNGHMNIIEGREPPAIGSLLPN